MGSLEGIEIQAATIQVSVERKIPYFAFLGPVFNSQFSCLTTRDEKQKVTKD